MPNGDRDPVVQPTEGSMGGGSSLRQLILLRLRRDGLQTPDRLAAGLGTTRGVVLQHLRALEAAGLVRRQAERHGVGRPRHVFDVTPEAQRIFPTNYDGLAVGLLAALAELGGDDLVGRVFGERRRQLADRISARLAALDDPGLDDKVQELAAIQDDHGYVADVVLGPDGTIRLREHNCAIYDVAARQPTACSAELELFREVLDADVVRETHIAAGDRCCSYLVSARPDA